MQISIVVPHLVGGGAEHVAGKWAQSLSQLGHSVSVLLTHGDPETTSMQGVRVESIAARTPFGRIRLLRAHIRQHSTDVTIAVMPYCNLLAVLAAVGLPCRVAVSEHTIHSSAVNSMSLSSRLQWFLARFLYKKADACFAASHALAAELSAACKVSPSRLWVIPNPVAHEAHDGTRNLRLDEASGVLKLVSPTRLVSGKRLHLVIEAAHLVGLTGAAVEVHFFGTGPDRERLEATARRAGVSANFHGRVEKWWQCSPPGAIMLLTSGIEGFGNVLVEAAAQGIPSVVSSKALGVADACVPGVTAQLVAGDSAQDFAEGILRAVEMRKFVESTTVTSWLNRFSPNEVARLIENILLRITALEVRDAASMDESMAARTS